MNVEVNIKTTKLGGCMITLGKNINITYPGLMFEPIDIQLLGYSLSPGDSLTVIGDVSQQLIVQANLGDNWYSVRYVTSDKNKYLPHDYHGVGTEFRLSGNAYSG